MPARTKGKNKKLSENEESQNIINLKIVDSILDDNEKEFTNIILQKTIDKSNFDYQNLIDIKILNSYKKFEKNIFINKKETI